MNIAKIKIEKGDELIPTKLVIQFTPMPLYFAFRQGRLEKWLGSEADLQKFEVKEAIRSCSYMFEKELWIACKEQLGVDLK